MMTGLIHTTSMKLTLDPFVVDSVFVFLSVSRILLYMHPLPWHLLVIGRQEISHPSTEHVVPSLQPHALALDGWQSSLLKSSSD